MLYITFKSKKLMHTEVQIYDFLTIRCINYLIHLIHSTFYLSNLSHYSQNPPFDSTNFPRRSLIYKITFLLKFAKNCDHLSNYFISIFALRSRSLFVSFYMNVIL